MTTVTISTKYQVVIPKKVREIMKINSGMKLEVIPYENRIELIPIKSVKSLKGALKGIDTNIKREKDRL
ncbi:AbrB/MazE/SpoVT family DNA-binding domain-containing protein [Candidatus Peregrinibacteria bacterium]|nr:AbrB/MazE/SpoVT family DNA-binding domain-containing protein [Candidatus Peregrinibacteria bacterium]